LQGGKGLFVKLAIRLTVMMLVLLVAISAQAATTGKIAGKITDKESGEPLPGVSVLIVGTTVGAATNVQGEYFIINVPPGNYSLRATLVGYRPVEAKNVQVSVDLTTSQDFQLSSQAVEMGTVTVEAVKPLIEKDLTSSRTTISPTQLTDSPINGIVNVANLTAGAVSGHFRGGREDQGEVVYMLDGVNLSNPIGETRVGRNPGSGSTTALATYIPNEAIAEAEVLTGGFGAEYPNVQSAVVNIVTKSGGDKFTGKLKSKSSPEVLVRRTFNMTNVFHIPVIDANGDTTIRNISMTSPKVDSKNRSDDYNFRQHEFSFGGPIPISSVDIPGKMSFFASGIYAYNRSYQDMRAWTRDQTLMGKLTYEFSASKKLTFTGLSSKGSSLGWDRERLLTLTWGEPTYYHKYNVSTATNQTELVDTFYTPYSWIVAPGHLEIQADSVYFNSVRQILIHASNNPGWADSSFTYATVPDSFNGTAVKFAARDSVNATGWAKSYTNYDMGNTLGRPKTSSYEFDANFSNNISAKSFYNIGYSRFKSGQTALAYDPWSGLPLSATDILDPRFLPAVTAIEGAQLRANPMFVSRYRQVDNSITNDLKGDFTSQVNSANFIKFGSEYKWYNILYDYVSVASGNNNYNSQYHVKPFQLGAFAQDKIETQGMIVNLGLRYDYFDPKTVVPINFHDPLNAAYIDPSNPLYGNVTDLLARLKNPVTAKAKQQLSPRIGVSYPITDKDVLHVTYGHYFQLPVFDDFYTNQAFDLRGAFKYIGNANLSEEKTIAYEAGIEHGFNDFLKLAVTGFYKDISGLINAQRFEDPGTGQVFWIYSNSDYARSKGFEITFTQRPWHNFSGLLTYTYQNAKGRASDKTQAFLDNYFNRKPRTQDFTLDWDQRHTLKADVNWRSPESAGPVIGDFGLDAVFTYGSGFPYTGISRVVAPNLPPINDKRFPSTWEIDLRVDKGVTAYRGINTDIFLEVTNLTNRANINAPFDSYHLDQFNVEKYEATGDPSGQFGDPYFWSAPRRILLGAQLSF
jgi:outer membrane receptor protein involved in Fe transport